MLRDEKGNAALELVVVAPALLLLIALIVGSGRMFTTKSALESIAREAARSASQASSAAAAMAEAEARAIETAGGMGIDPARLTVRTDAGNFDRGSPLTVSVTYEIALADLPGFGLIPPTVTVEAKHVEIVERYKSR